MAFFTALKATIVAGGFALAGAAGHAATIASISVTDGNVNLGAAGTIENPFSLTSALQVTGDFDAFVDLDFDPDTLGLYTLAADLTVDGTEVFNDSISAVTTATDIVMDAIDIALTIDSLFPGVLGNLLTEAVDGSLDQTEIATGVWLGLDLVDSDLSDGTLAGGLTAVLSEEELAEPGFLLFGSPGIDFSGSASLSIDVSAVPLPATAPLLGFALAGLIAVRRQKLR